MYYQARISEQKPYLVFDCVARSDDELIERQLCQGTTDAEGNFVPNQPLEPIKGVLAEKDLPKEVFGICEKTLDSAGNLVPVSATVLATAKAEFEAEEKVAKCQTIDRETEQAIAAGFAFDGQTFSLSQNAQLNWQGIWLAHQANIFKDQEVATKSGGAYLLKKAKVLEFVKAANKAVTDALKAGRTKKGKL